MFCSFPLRLARVWAHDRFGRAWQASPCETVSSGRQISMRRVSFIPCGLLGCMFTTNFSTVQGATQIRVWVWCVCVYVCVNFGEPPAQLRALQQCSTSRDDANSGCAQILPDDGRAKRRPDPTTLHRLSSWPPLVPSSLAACLGESSRLVLSCMAGFAMTEPVRSGIRVHVGVVFSHPLRLARDRVHDWFCRAWQASP